jgi:hypothetical protein
MSRASRQRQADRCRALQGRIFGWTLCGYPSYWVAHHLNIPVKVVLRRGFPTWEEFRGWQETKIKRYLDTPEAKARKAQMELDIAAQDPYTFPPCST